MKRMKNGISNKGLDRLCEVIQKLDGLEKLELNFTDFSGMGNGRVFENRFFVKRLLDGPQMGLKSVSESLKKLEKLKQIHLNFAGYLINFFVQQKIDLR